MNIISGGLILIGAMALLVLFSFAMAWPTMALVNGLFSKELIKSVFGVEQIGWMTAWGFNVLCMSLFKSSNSGSSK
jgi:hypothetical protein